MRWPRLTRRFRVDDGLSEEVEHYLEMAAAEYVRSGLSRDEALRRARLDFGGVEAAKEAVRSAGWQGAFDTIWRDAAYALRGLRRNPSFTIVAVLTLALGIGANTAMFSVVNAVLLRPLPYEDADRLTLIYSDDVERGLHEEALAYRTIQDLRGQASAFESIGAFYAQRATIVDRTERVRSRSSFVSGNLFSLMGVTPELGRSILPADEEQAQDVAAISYRLWMRRFNGDSSAIGQILPLVVNGHDLSLRIVGVMRPDFVFPDNTEIWIPATKYWRFQREYTERSPDWARRWTAIGRIKATASVAVARNDLANIGQRLTRAYPTSMPEFPGFSTNVVPLIDSIAGPGLQAALWTLLGAVGLVLLVACANVAHLLLARGATRQREFAIRRAIGAPRARLVRQLVVESTVLAAIGGALGVLLALVSTRVFASMAAAILPRMDELSIDGRVLFFAASASIVASIIFGLAPAFRVVAGDASAALRQGMQSASAGLHRMRGLLVVAECAFAVVLLAGAGLLIRSLERLNAVDPGFDPRGVLSVRIEFPAESPEMRAMPANQAIRMRNLATRVGVMTERIRTIPGVESVGFIDDMFVNGQGNASITIPGRPSDVATGELNEGDISPGFLSTLRVPIVRGRNLTSEDLTQKIRALWHPVVASQSLDEKEQDAIAEPVVVNQAFVRRFFSSEDPIGKRFCTDPLNKTYWYEIVGVVGDMHRQGLDREAIPEFYGPHLPAPTARADLLVRTAGTESPLRLASVIRRTIGAELPGTVIASETTADRQLGDFAARRRLQTWLLSAFAGLALTLAAIGIYGVVHYAVAERTREIGVRIALGASPSSLFAFVVRRGLIMPAIGIAIGIGASFVATRLLVHLLFGVGAADPLTFALVLLTLGATAFAACVLPARRAARLDPIAALRGD